MLNIPYFLILRSLLLMMIGYYMIIVPSWLHASYGVIRPVMPLVGLVLMATSSLRLTVPGHGSLPRALDFIIAGEYLGIAGLFVRASVSGVSIYVILGLVTLWYAVFGEEWRK